MPRTCRPAVSKSRMGCRVATSRVSTRAPLQRHVHGAAPGHLDQPVGFQFLHRGGICPDRRARQGWGQRRVGKFAVAVPGHFVMTRSTTTTGDLISCGKVEGTSVYDSAGDKLGSIDDPMIDKRTGQVRYAV